MKNNLFNNHFNIKGTEYANIPLNSDTALFVDPNRLKLLNTKLFDSKTAIAKINAYFLRVFDLYLSGEKELAIDLLEAPQEINATHLGLSKGRSQGTGPSREILNRFFEKVTLDGRLRKALLARPVLIPLFVKNFGPDRFSDLIVYIISKELADFTRRICKKYGLPTHQTELCTYYDITTRKWQKLIADLPVGPDNQPILLVPNEIAVEKYGFSAEKYVQHILLVSLQTQHLKEGSPLVTYKLVKGSMTAVKPSKKKLYRFEIIESYDENGKVKAFALDKSLENPHLLEQYIEFVQGKTYHLKKDKPS